MAYKARLHRQQVVIDSSIVGSSIVEGPGRFIGIGHPKSADDIKQLLHYHLRPGLTMIIREKEYRQIMKVPAVRMYVHDLTPSLCFEAVGEALMVMPEAANVQAG